MRFVSTKLSVYSQMCFSEKRNHMMYTRHQTIYKTHVSYFVYDIKFCNFCMNAINGSTPIVIILSSFHCVVISKSSSKIVMEIFVQCGGNMFMLKSKVKVDARMGT